MVVIRVALTRGLWVGVVATLPPAVAPALISPPNTLAITGETFEWPADAVVGRVRRPHAHGRPLERLAPEHLQCLLGFGLVRVLDEAHSSGNDVGKHDAAGACGARQVLQVLPGGLTAHVVDLDLALDPAWRSSAPVCAPFKAASTAAVSAPAPVAALGPIGAARVLAAVARAARLADANCPAVHRLVVERVDRARRIILRLVLDEGIVDVIVGVLHLEAHDLAVRGEHLPEFAHLNSRGEAANEEPRRRGRAPAIRARAGAVVGAAIAHRATKRSAAQRAPSPVRPARTARHRPTESSHTPPPHPLALSPPCPSPTPALLRVGVWHAPQRAAVRPRARARASPCARPRTNQEANTMSRR